MTKKELIEKAKLRVRKMSTDKLDDDLGQLVEVALADLSRVGVHESHLKNIRNPLLVEAVLLYASANFGSPENRAALMASYDMMLDGELRETQTADYFSSLCPIDCTVPSLNA